MTFIVRLDRDEAGRLTGIVERVRTGEKAQVHGIDEVGAAIARMFACEPADGSPAGREERQR
jgi:hypothetical protein